MDLVEDGGQEDRGRRDIQGRQVERRFIRPGTWKTELAHSGTPMGSGAELATDG